MCIRDSVYGVNGSELINNGDINAYEYAGGICAYDEGKSTYDKLYNCLLYTSTGYTYDTIRGTMKTVVGTSYSTKMQYNGIISELPVTKDEKTIGEIKNQLGYLYPSRKTKGDTKWICFLEGQ